MIGKVLKAMGAFTAAAVVSSGAILWSHGERLSDMSERLDRLSQPEESDVTNMPPLSEAGEKLRAEYLVRLDKNMPGLTMADKCSAYYVALQQSEQLKLREEFIASSKASGHSEQEINRGLGLAQNYDTPYALHVFMMCGNGQKPQPFSLFIK